MAKEIIGTLLELSIFYFVFYKLLELNKNQIVGTVMLYLSMTALVVFCNQYILGYGGFIYIFALIVTMKLFSKESLFKVLFVFIAAMIGLLLVEIVTIPLMGLVTKNELVTHVAILSFANILIYFIITKFESKLIHHVQKHENMYINFIAINMFLYAFIYKILWDYNESIVRDNMLYFGIAMVLLLVVNYFVYKEVASISERNKALEVQDQMRETLDLMITEIRTKQHEYKNNITTVVGIVETNEPEEATGKILEFLTDVQKFDAFNSSLLTIDRDIVKAVLFMKESEAHEKNIAFDFYCHSDLNQMKILDYEISLILNNLLNNAFEAVEVDAHPAVSLEMGFDDEQELYYFKTKNAGHDVNPASLTKLTDKNFTTKSKNKKEHGFGLWNIKNIIKKYGGHLELYFEGNDLVIKVLFA